MTTIKQILEWPTGYSSGGFDLTVITAKKLKKVGNGWIQRATLSDSKDEILASFILPNNVPLQSNDPVHITTCNRTELDLNNKMVPAIVVNAWSRPTMTADEWEGEKDIIKTEYDTFQDKRIRGMIRHGLVCAVIRNRGICSPTVTATNIINEWVEYIMDG